MTEVDRAAFEDLHRMNAADVRRGAPDESLSHQRVRRRTLLMGAAAVTAGACGLVIVGPFATTRPSIAATPPMLDNVLGSGEPARDALHRLAVAAQADTELPGDGTGPHVVRTESWALSTRIDGKQVRSAVVPEITELTWNADRSGHLTTRTGKPYFPNSEYQSAWKADGSAGKQGTVTREHSWQPGGYSPMVPILPLPADDDALLAALKAAHPIDKLGTGELIIAINDLYNETQPGPAVRASLLRLLAARPDVSFLGRMTDRAGRPVESFAVDTTLTGLPQRQIVMFSPTTGTLLATEEILTKHAGQLGIRIPSVIGYRLYAPV